MGQGTKTIASLLLLASGLFLPPSQKPVVAQEQPCALALVLAIDASSSVNDHEYRLQMEGTAQALLDEEVSTAILSLSGVYVAGFEWNGEANQSMLFEWSYLDEMSDIVAVSQRISRHVRNNRKAPTALGSALGYAHRLFPKLPVRCWQKVIDVSGDGISNHGIKPAAIYQLYDFSDITVNGLAILNPRRRNRSYFDTLDEYYRLELINGPAAFVLVAEGFEDFSRAIKAKLLKEFSPSPVGMLQSEEQVN